MKQGQQSAREYDVIVVGARVAGAATAMLLARQGHRVLMVDRRQPGTDTLSTLALMRGAVLQLKRWNLLERVIESDSPAIKRAIVHYGKDPEVIELKSRSGVGELYAPRRYVLDSILVDAAAAAGVEVRFGLTVTALQRDDSGRVIGLTGRDELGEPFSARGRHIVGADGIKSLVAREVEAPITRQGEAATAVIYQYRSGLSADRYDWFYRPGVAAGIIPTNDGEACVWAGTTRERFMSGLRFDLERSFDLLLGEAAPQAADRIRQGEARSRLYGFPGIPGFMRQPWGDGWVLVGDASHFKDPISAHGMTDALRDAEFLALALDSALRGDVSEEDALGSYHRTRDELTIDLFDISEKVAAYEWNLGELRGLLLGLSKAMKHEVEALASLDEERAAFAA